MQGSQHPFALTDARLRILVVLMLAFTFSAMHTPLSLALMVALTIALVLLSGTSLTSLARRLRLPGLVVGGLVVILPFTSGVTVLASIGPLTLREEGLAAAFGIALRFLCIFALVASTLGTLPVMQLITGLRGLGVPVLLVDMALLTLRHFEDLRADLARMQVAARLRGGGAAQGLRLRTWAAEVRDWGWILASLLLRSHARSERVYHAMILRGHGAQGAAPPDTLPVSRKDKLWLLVMIGLAAGLLVGEHLV